MTLSNFFSNCSVGKFQLAFLCFWLHRSKRIFLGGRGSVSECHAHTGFFFQNSLVVKIAKGVDRANNKGIWQTDLFILRALSRSFGNNSKDHYGFLSFMQRFWGRIWRVQTLVSVFNASLFNIFFLQLMIYIFLLAFLEHLKTLRITRERFSLHILETRKHFSQNLWPVKSWDCQFRQSKLKCLKTVISTFPLFYLGLPPDSPCSLPAGISRNAGMEILSTKNNSSYSSFKTILCEDLMVIFLKNKQ